MASKLTAKQERFVEEYLIDLNATQAAIRAGYSPKGAEVRGSELLRNRKVRAAVDAAKAERSARTQVSQDRVLTELARLAYSDMREFAKWGPDGVRLRTSDDLAEHDAACVAEVSQTITKDGGTIRFKLHDKAGALRDLGRHLAMFTDKVKGEVELGGVLRVPGEPSDWEDVAADQQNRLAALHGKNGRNGSGSGGA